MAIRTFEFAGDRAWLGVGGGVVADSDPAAEARECAVKAAPLLAAIGAASRSERVCLALARQTRCDCAARPRADARGPTPRRACSAR